MYEGGWGSYKIPAPRGLQNIPAPPLKNAFWLKTWGEVKNCLPASHSLLTPNKSQESPRQTKPKAGQFMNFSLGQTRTKVRCESHLFSQGKTPEFTKMGEIHELFVLDYVALRGPPKTQKFKQVKSRSESRFRGVPESRPKVGQKYTNSYTFDLLLTYFQGPPGTYFRTYLNFLGFWGASRRTRATFSFWPFFWFGLPGATPEREEQISKISTRSWQRCKAAAQSLPVCMESSAERTDPGQPGLRIGSDGSRWTRSRIGRLGPLCVCCHCLTVVAAIVQKTRVPNPPGANPLVAEKAFRTSDYWGRTGVARCAEE